MRFFAPIFSVLAAVAVAQSTQCTTNCILVPNGGLDVTAGQSYTLTWSNPSSGTITIKLQSSLDITPSSGTVLASSVPASAGTYTVQIPADLVNSNQYTFETIDDSNSNNINFSPTFAISGATAVSSMVSSTATSSTGTSTGSSSTGSSSTESKTNSSSTMTSTGSTMSTMSTMTASRTSSSSSTSSSTSAPNSNTNSASSLKVEGALIALVAGIMAAL